MAPRLKVFTWSDGFHAFTVATSSRPKALEAWGSKQDLFATGLASELSDGPDYDAALQSPGEVVERGLAVDIGKIKRSTKARPERAASKARLEKVTRLETRLRTLDVDHASTLEDLDEEARQIEARRAEAERDYARDRQALVRELKAARR